MPWYPRAVRKQLTVPNRAKYKVAMTPVRINLHTAVSNGGSIYGFFNSSGARGVFSHFYITKTGGVEQYQDTSYRASCDLDGNPDTISIESWDGYPSGWDGYWRNYSDVPPWNTAQMAALHDLLAWIYATHSTIPRKLATSNRRGRESQGLSWHRLGVVGAPGYISPTSGGLRYSTSVGKACPGPRRIAQIPELFARLTPKPPAASAGASSDTRTDLERWLDAMDEKTLRAMIREESTEAAKRALWDNLVPAEAGKTMEGSSVRNVLRHISVTVTALAAKAGVEIDEGQIIRGVTEALLPEVRDAALDAAQAGGSPEAIADAVVAKLGTALTQD